MTTQYTNYLAKFFFGTLGIGQRNKGNIESIAVRLEETHLFGKKYIRIFVDYTFIGQRNCDIIQEFDMGYLSYHISNNSPNYCNPQVKQVEKDANHLFYLLREVVDDKIKMSLNLELPE